MLISSFLAATIFAASAFTSPLASPLASTHVVHERRAESATQWVRRETLDRRALLPMRVGLAQRNLDRAMEWLNEVSHPDSEKYGQHWSAKEVAEAFAPSDETVAAVKAWLTAGGIHGSRIKQSQGLNWLEFEATVDEAEQILQTKYHVYEHGATGQPHVACDDYSIPANLQKHIDFVYPTVHMDAKVLPRNEESINKRAVSSDVRKGLGWPGSGSLPKFGPHRPHGPWDELAKCDEYIVPDCLRALYEFPVNQIANSKNSYGIVEYTPQAYVPSDLDLFFKNFSKDAVGSRPITDLIDGAVVQQADMGFEYNGESNLDLEYAMSLVYPQKVTLYQVGDLVEGGSFNNFLDAIDASYCTYEGGDDPLQDAAYPDPYGGYQGPENCGGFAATKVISTSYAYNEADLTPFYEKRQCHEYMKLGLQGVSVLYSTGDYGVAGNEGECLVSGVGTGNATFNNGSSGIFNPSFPATCPYVSAIGATQVKNNTNIVSALATGTQPEMACETVIYSGGGFSNVFPIPDYQKSAVDGFLSKYPPPYTAARYNNSGIVRAFPDFSANGANFVVAIDGNFSLVYGTSAASPTFGSVLTLINEQRLNVGKSSVGFINPVLYAHPDVLNDVTEGGNQGCGTAGYEAAPGWDPVTGLGTPNFPKMLALWLGLP